MAAEKNTGGNKLTAVEHIKSRSNYLRGTLLESLADSATGALAEDDTQLSKFHGFYQQDDRDVREQRRRQLLEPDHQFMIRARVPGGVCTCEQWLALDRIAREYANGTIRITTRQAVQLHGVLKHRLKPTIRGINDSLLDTFAACGDVNRNVMCTSLPETSSLHLQVFQAAAALSEHLTPNTTAYHEIWLDKEKIAGGDHEPIYGPSYLPRKFKISFAIPPRNDVDVYAHDLSFIAITGNGTEKGELIGFNVTVGGGMGVSHGDPGTYPRLADVIGFCSVEQVVGLAEAVVMLQRDHGDRSERKHARLKYTIDDHGLEWFHQELEQRLGYRLEAAKDFAFTHTGDRYGWQKTADGYWHLGLFIQNGRVADRGPTRLLSGLRAIAEVHDGEFRFTANQNLIICNVQDPDRERIDQLVRAHGLDGFNKSSPLRLNSMACVGFPTCGLSLAESERYLPDLVTKIESLLADHDLSEQAITIRMTGCPNGCARPYLAEIGLIGKGPGLYNLHLGAAYNGDRLNRMFRESVQESEILKILDELFGGYVSQRNDEEHFGDYLLRSGVLDAAVEKEKMT